MSDSINILIVSNDTALRTRLKEALSNILYKGSVLQARSTKEAFELVNELKDLVAIFMRSDLEREAVHSLLEAVKESPLRYQPLYVVSLHSDHNLSECISDSLLSGIEGFIKEPFSADQVNEVISLAIQNREKQIEEEQRKLGAIRFMLHDACGLIDEAAFERYNSNRKGGGFARKRMNRLVHRVRDVLPNILPEQLEPILTAEVDKQIKQLDLSKFKKKSTKIVFAEHPGKILTDLIEERRLSHERLCELLHIPKDTLLDILEEKAGVTPELSKELARVMGGSEDYWLSLQNNYEAYARTLSLT